jgi:hypothetical protein
VRERIAEHQRKHRRKHRHRPGRGRSEPPVCSAVSSEKTRSVSPRCAPTPAL